MVLGQSQTSKGGSEIHILMLIFTSATYWWLCPFLRLRAPVSELLKTALESRMNLAQKLWPPVTLKAQPKRLEMGKD